MILINDNFLEMNSLENEKYDLILMNPPWAATSKQRGKKVDKKHNGGVDFIDKAVNLLKEGGVLVGIDGFENFNPKRINPTKGSFRDLLNRGYFKKIVTESGDKYCEKTSHFFGRSDNVWFVFVKDTKNPQVKKNRKTLIENKWGERFETILKENMKFIPQLPNEDEYFDWNDGVEVPRFNNKHKGEPLPLIYDIIAIKTMKGEIVVECFKKGTVLKNPLPGIINDEGLYDEQKVKELFEKLNKKQNYVRCLYSGKAGRLRLPPIKKSLILK